ncbi:MAG: hypothetical protein AB8E82_11335 [Aureispira sp.]
MNHAKTIYKLVNIMGVGFTINRIITEQFALFPEAFNANQEVQVANSFNFSLNPLNQQVGVYASFDFKQQQLLVMRIVVSCHFGIENKAWNSFIEGQSICLPLDFATNLFSITTGTTRGVLASKTENTPFSQYIVPLLDVQNIITSEIVFRFD